MQSAWNLLADAAGSGDRPHVGVLHGGFRAGDFSLRAEIGDPLAVRRPDGLILLALGVRKAALFAAGNIHGEDVVVEFELVERTAVRLKENFFAVRRPIDAVL